MAEKTAGFAVPPDAPKRLTIPLGVVVRRRPGVTRWAAWAWDVAAVLPGAGPAEWRVLRHEAGVTEYHAATLDLDLHRADVEAYRVALTMTPPSVFVVLRDDPSSPSGQAVFAVTASAYEAQDYQDSDELVEPVAMPAGLAATVQDFVTRHWVETPFVKRRRDRTRTDLKEDGVGDRRVRQEADVYRAPAARKPEPR